MHAPAPLSFPKAAPWLLFIAAIFFLNFVGRTIFSPIMVPLELELGITHARAGRFFLDVSLGYGFTLLVAGFVNSRISHRRTIALMPLVMGVVLLALSVCHSVVLFEVLLVAFGMCGGLYLPSGVSAVTSLVAPKDLGKAIAVHELAPNLSLILSPLIAQFFLDFATWRTALATLGVASLVMSVLFALFGRGGEFRSDAPSFSAARELMLQPIFWVLAILFSLAISGSMAPYSVLPLYLVDAHSMEPAEANKLLSLSRLLTPLVAFFAGWAVDKVGSKTTIAVTMPLTGLATILIGICHGPWLFGAILAQPVFSVCYFAAGFALLSHHFPPQSRSLAISLIIPTAIISGFGLVPAMLGWLGDRNAFHVGFILIGVSIALSPLVLPLIPREPATRAEENSVERS